MEVSEWREVRRWDIEEGTWTRVHERPGALHRWTLTAPPQLPGTAVALTHDMDLAVEKDPYTRVTVARARVLNFWSVGRRRWLLPTSTAVDHEPSRRTNAWERFERAEPRLAEQVVVLADSEEEPVAAALRFKDGHLLVYRLENTAAYRPLTVRQRLALRQSDIQDWEARADQLTATLWQTVAPQMWTRVTVCAAPRDLPPMSLLLGRVDGRVVEFDLDTGETGPEVRTGHEGPVTHIDLVTGHPQGRLLVTAGDDRSVRVSSVSGGAPVRTLLAGNSAVASFAIGHMDHQWIVAIVTDDGLLHRIDLDSGRPIGLPLRVDRGTSARVEAFRLGAGFCLSVQGDTRGLQLFDLVSGERIGGQVADHSATAVCTVDDVVCVGGSDGVIRLWPTAHVTDSVHFTAHEGPVLALTAIRGPSGTAALVSVGGDYEIRCWDPVRAEERWRRSFLDPGRHEVPLVGSAATGRTADGRDFVVTGEYGGRVGVLLLRDGLPVAEQEFTVPDTVTALTAGRVGNRDVVVVGTASGRLACWDVVAGRMYVQGPLPEEPVWTTAVALAPDGSGRVATGGFDGTVREWSLPTCRQLGPTRAAHRGRVCALAYDVGDLVGSGGDQRLVSYADGWERRMPRPAGVFRATQGGLLCGDEGGEVWRLVNIADGRRVTEAFDSPGTVWAAADVPGDGRSNVVTGGDNGVLQVRDGRTGTLLSRLRPTCDSGIDDLRVVTRWPSPDGTPRTVLFSRSDSGLLEHWDFAEGSPPRVNGSPLVTPAPHTRALSRLAVLPDGKGRETLLSLTTWDADPMAHRYVFQKPSWAKSDIHLAVHDIAHGPLLDQPCRPLGETTPLGTIRAVRCGDTPLVLVPLGSTVIRVLDVTARRWAELPGDELVDVFPTTVAGRAGILVVGARWTRIFAWEDLNARLARGGERPTRVWPGERRRLRGRRAKPPMVPVHEHAGALRRYLVRHTALLPDGLTYAVAGHTQLAVVGIHDGRVHREIDLPSRCTALTTGPAGELIVGTRNGVILFD
ncbi:WD40 repeat domain-containing protein [Streptomyces sp. S3(2020)]|uniref:WD40 repeat domain-containing protein n=1 Tax=Streptomyces sp. S3(2020) TaxID=2732044 RepID=UPI0014876B40|nr:WD40 repeat domain-containing protein [Streptomyces sp. S3(2020)]NNN37430.1 WD40 repeat domain-containing protein [Streptomyces sp. S3(2020)]